MAFNIDATGTIQANMKIYYDILVKPEKFSYIRHNMYKSLPFMHLPCHLAFEEEQISQQHQGKLFGYTTKHCWCDLSNIQSLLFCKDSFEQAFRILKLLIHFVNRFQQYVCRSPKPLTNILQPRTVVKEVSIPVELHSWSKTFRSIYPRSSMQILSEEIELPWIFPTSYLTHSQTYIW